MYTKLDRIIQLQIEFYLIWKLVKKYQKKELKGNYNFTEGEYHLANFLDRKLPYFMVDTYKANIKKMGTKYDKKNGDQILSLQQEIWNHDNRSKRLFRF